MNQDNDFMKQLTDMLYKDVVQKLEPPLPQVPSNDTNNTTNPIIDTSPPSPPADTKEKCIAESYEINPKTQCNLETRTPLKREKFKLHPDKNSTCEEAATKKFQDLTNACENYIAEPEEAGETSEEAGETSEEAGETSEEAGETSEEAGETSEEAGETSEEAASSLSIENTVGEDKEGIIFRDTNGDGEKEEETKQPMIRANSLNFDAIVGENELLSTGNSREQQHQIVNAALAALMASKQTINEGISIDDKTNQQQIVNAALTALLASKQTTEEGIQIDDKASQQQIVNAALAALLASKQTTDDNQPLKQDKQQLSQMLETLERTKQSGLSGISTMKDSMKEMYKNIPTIEMPKFMANIFEGLIEPDLEYYNVPDSINNKITTVYGDYKVVAIKCNSWDENNYCKEEGGKYYLYSSKDDKPKIIVLDAKGGEIK